MKKFLFGVGLMVFVGWSWGSGWGQGILNIAKHSINFTERSSDIATPQTNNIRIYAKDDEGTTKLYTKDSDGTVTGLVTDTFTVEGDVSGTDSAFKVERIGDFQGSGSFLGIGTWSVLYNSGSEADVEGDHGIASLSYAYDTADGQFHLYGGESRVNAYGTSSIYTGHLALMHAVNDTTSSTYDAFEARSEIVALDDSTPLLEGTRNSIHVKNGIGGSTHNGILIDDLTGATTDVGINIVGADSAAIWVGSGADNTDVYNGIFWGQSADTNLYRGAANQLKTDDNLSVALDIDADAISTDGNETLAIDVIQHTITATDVSNGYWTETYNKCTHTNVRAMRALIYTAGGTAVSTTRDKVTLDSGVPYIGVIDENSDFVENDVHSVMVIYEE